MALCLIAPEPAGPGDGGARSSRRRVRQLMPLAGSRERPVSPADGGVLAHQQR